MADFLKNIIGGGAKSPEQAAKPDSGTCLFRMSLLTEYCQPLPALVASF